MVTNPKYKGTRPAGQITDQFGLISKFPYGYRNREDITNLPPGVLVKGSKNVLTNVSERIQARKGYTLDGAGSSTFASILSAYTWNDARGKEHNFRAYPNSSTTGILQYRYDNGTSITWNTLKSDMASANINFTEFLDTTEKSQVMLFVDGSANIYEWSGGITTIASVTNNTITKQGTSTWAYEGFYTTGTRKITIRGVDYTYTGGETTTTLTGVTPDPTAQGANTPVAGDVAIQTVRTTTNASMSLALVNNDLIATQNNYVFVGSKTYPVFYQSKLSDYKTWTQSSPRLVGEGCLFTIDAPPTAFVVREDTMTISAGKNLWYNIQRTQSSDLTKETLTAVRLKTNDRQSAQSQALVSKFKNNVVFISNEPTMDSLGRVENIYGTVQTTNMSDPIKLDFDTYDFTDGSMFYNRYFIYVAVPKEGLVLIYNLVRKYWEAPQTIPISRFYTVNGELYGHSYNTPESYKLFSGESDNGFDIETIANFSYQSFNQRWLIKNFQQFYVEGYISSNTNLKLNLTFDLDGWASKSKYNINGDDTQIVAIRSAGGSLGSAPLGSNPLGSSSNTMNPNDLPPKFRVIKTFPSTNFWEYQASFSSLGKNQNWEIVAFGPAVKFGPTQPTSIRQ